MLLVLQSILLIGTTCYILSSLLFFLARDMPHIHQGVGWWALASIAGAVGYASLLYHESSGNPVTGEAMYNLSLISWASFLHIGAHQWFKKPLAYSKTLAIGSLATLWVIYFNFIQPVFLPAAIITALTCGTLLLHTCWLFLKFSPPQSLHSKLLIGALFISGVHILDYPILRPHESLAIFGILLCILASLSINILLASMVIIQFKDRMQSSKQQAINIAMQDPLTGLKNRLGLVEAFNQLTKFSESKEQQIAIIFIDLDDFKAINDHHGHEDGDEVLKIIATRLSTTTRQQDIAARLGGDEFVVIFNNKTGDREYLPQFIGRLIDRIQRPVKVDRRIHRVGASIGLAVYPKDGTDLQVLLSHADHSMYLDKRMKKNTGQKRSAPPQSHYQLTHIPPDTLSVTPVVDISPDYQASLQADKMR